MTAYLQPGDVIHLVVPRSYVKTGPLPIEEFMQSDLGDTVEFYRSQGVTVGAVTNGPGLTHPIVVAVFRDRADLTPAQQLDAECKALGLTPHPFRVNAVGNCQVCGGGRYDRAHTGVV